MRSPLERRYRRLLRILPVGYRDRWEEDMVSAFLESANATHPDVNKVSASRPRWAERLSVVALAVRVRLSGSHASPRGLIGYDVVRSVALLGLLYQALIATVSIAFSVGIVLQLMTSAEVPRPRSLEWLVPMAVSLLWVAAFGSYVLGRPAVVRVLVASAFLSNVIVEARLRTIESGDGQTVSLIDPIVLARWGWLAALVVAVFVGQPHTRPSQRFWFGLYLVGSLISAPIVLLMLSPLRTPRWLLGGPEMLEAVASVALIVSMVVALRRVTSGRHRSPNWLFALTVFAGGIGVFRLMKYIARSDGPFGAPAYMVELPIIDAVLVAVALVCASVGAVVLIRRGGAGKPYPGQFVSRGEASKT